MHWCKEASPDMLFQMAWFLVGLTAELALVWSIIAHHLQVLLESQARVLGWDEACSVTCEQATRGLPCEKRHFTLSRKTQRTHSDNNVSLFIPRTNEKLPRVGSCICQGMLLPKSVMRMGSCKGISGRGRLFLDTFALLVFRGNLCFLCCKLLKWEAMCVFLWPDVRKILSQWGQGKGRTPRKSKGGGGSICRELMVRESDWMWHLYLEPKQKAKKARSWTRYIRIYCP